MDHTYQRPLQLPAGYSVLSAEEMTYTEGGALSINITPEQVMAFGINVTVNLLGMMGRYAFQAAVSGMQNALNDGLGVGDAIGHFWGKLNIWSKVATVGLAGLGGYYAYIQARSIYLTLKGFVTELKDAVGERHLKVILETGCLKTAENIKKASVLAMYSGADFIKTSTGKMYPGASLEAAYVMCQCIKDYYQKHGVMIGFKAAGGIRTTEDAVKYYTIVKEVLGEEWLSNEHFRIGASSLANALFQSFTGTDAKPF